MSALTDEEMLCGYLTGFNSGSEALPECYKLRSAAFRHGWLNGRDDRNGTPRERADVLRKRAAMIDGAKA